MCFQSSVYCTDKSVLFLLLTTRKNSKKLKLFGIILTLFSSSFFELLTSQRPGFSSPPILRFITPKLLKLSLLNLSRVKIIYLIFVRAKKFLKIHLIKYAKLQFSKVTTIFTFRHSFN